MLLEFVDKLRRHPWLRNAWFIYMCERNTGQVAGHQAILLKNHRQVYSMHEKAHDMPGVWTDKVRKQDFAHAVRFELESNSICFLTDFVCLPQAGDEQARRKWLVTELATQMQRARLKPSLNAQNSVSGYVGWDACSRDDGKKDPSLHDDLLLGICINVYFSVRFLHKELAFVDYRVFERDETDPYTGRMHAIARTF